MSNASPSQKVRKVDYSADEFLVGIAGLSPEEIGVYWTACSLMLSSGGEIPRNDERLYRLVNARPSRITRIVDDLVAKGKLIVNGEYLVHKRVVNELNSARRRIAHASEAADKRWETERQKQEIQTPANAPASEPALPAPMLSLTPPQSLISISAKAESPSGQSKEPAGFPEFYMAFPLKKKRPQAAKAYARAIKAGASPGDLLAGAQRYAVERRGEEARFTQHPATWLNAECWKDEPVEDQKRGFRCPL